MEPGNRESTASDQEKGWSEETVNKYGPTAIRVASAVLGIAGLYSFCRSIRMFTRFKTAIDIPDEFYRRQVQLRGVVDSVADDGLLLVAHRPIMRLKWQKLEPSQISVRIAGVEVTSDGRNWLQHNILSKPVKFELVFRAGDEALSEVYAKRVTWSPLYYSVNTELARRGLCRVLSCTDVAHMDAMKTTPRYGRLVQRLLLSEHYADTRGVGYWSRPSILERIASYRSQVVQIVINSTAVVLLRTSAEKLKELLYFLWKTGERVYPIAKYGATVVFALAKRLYSFLVGILQLKLMYFRQPFGHALFRGIAKAHERYLNRSVLVKDNNVEAAMKTLNRLMASEKLFDIYRRTRYYMKPCEQRNQLSYTICKAIYDEDMRRKIALVSRKYRADRWPGQY